MASLSLRLAGLFLGFLKISGFTLGGGMVMLPLMEEEFVRRRQWLTAEDFIGTVTMVNALPGVICINSALLIGRRVAGTIGALAAVTGALIPSVLIILVLAPVIALLRGYTAVEAAFTAVRASVAALILLLLIRQGKKLGAGTKEFIFAGVALAAVRVAGVSPLIVIMVAALIGAFVFQEDA